MPSPLESSSPGPTTPPFRLPWPSPLLPALTAHAKPPFRSRTCRPPVVVGVNGPEARELCGKTRERAPLRTDDERLYMCESISGTLPEVGVRTAEPGVGKVTYRREGKIIRRMRLSSENCRAWVRRHRHLSAPVRTRPLRRSTAGFGGGVGEGAKSDVIRNGPSIASVSHVRRKNHKSQRSHCLGCSLRPPFPVLIDTGLARTIRKIDKRPPWVTTHHSMTQTLTWRATTHGKRYVRGW